MVKPDDCTPDQRIAILATEIAVLKERINGMAIALELQTAESARRLDELNHARRDREARDLHFVSRELHDGLAMTVTTAIAALDKRLTSIEGNSKGIRDSWGFVVGAGGLVAAAVMFLNWFAMR